MANEAEPQQKIIITDSSKMYEDMSPYYLRETFSDIQLILPDKKIHAHKIVLAARCKYFESLLMKNPKKQTYKITLRNVPSKAFETILCYMYTGSIAIASEDENDISDILQLAHEYSLKTLEKSIIEKMNSIVNLSNVCSFLNKANAHDMDELREICHTFIDKHVSQKLEYDFFNILTQKSMINLLKRDAFPVEEINVFKIVANWCKINKDLLNKLVIECIRISTLTRNEILTVVWPSKIVDKAKLLNALAAIEVNGPKETQRCFAGRLKDKNLATAEYNVKVISGLNTAMFFEETERYEEGAYHNEDDKNGITVDLGAVKCFNYIKMYVIYGSWPRYYIEVSTDLEKWHNVIDYSKYYCACIQNLYFEGQQARYIRIVLKTDGARICRFQVYMSSKVPKIHNQIVCPFSNIITSETFILSKNEIYVNIPLEHTKIDS
ncbi:BTB/POZ domain-containing protein 9-like isoform X2 [Zophobas morio]|uniref:BTB/POZ domain-containing protein 9-like isoform X2 n=1 Tax=Zophobas morio TaxID=2755281 RepID=UPI00308315EB